MRTLAVDVIAQTIRVHRELGAGALAEQIKDELAKAGFDIYSTKPNPTVKVGVTSTVMGSERG